MSQLKKKFSEDTLAFEDSNIWPLSLKAKSSTNWSQLSQDLLSYSWALTVPLLVEVLPGDKRETSLPWECELIDFSGFNLAKQSLSLMQAFRIPIQFPSCLLLVTERQHRRMGLWHLTKLGFESQFCQLINASFVTFSKLLFRAQFPVFFLIW